MNNRLKIAVENWLTAIMPSVVATLPDVLTVERIDECTMDKCIHGPYSIGFEKFGGPITAANFFVMATDQTIVLAVTATIRCNGDFEPGYNFDMVFPKDEFIEKLQEEETISTIVADLLEQLEIGYIGFTELMLINCISTK